MARDKSVTDLTRQRRREAGEHFRSLREAADLSQNDVARILGYSYYNTISQWERGAAPIPLDMYEPICAMLRVDLATFTRTMIQLSDPEADRLFKLAYGTGAKGNGENNKISSSKRGKPSS